MKKIKKFEDLKKNKIYDEEYSGSYMFVEMFNDQLAKFIELEYDEKTGNLFVPKEKEKQNIQLLNKWEIKKLVDYSK